jgi:peptide/nickel transport system substrate-binding protein
MTSVSDTTFAEAPWHNSVDGELTGLLVESWSISDDGTEWTLNLRQGVPFHHGYGEFTADDLIFNMTNSQMEGTTVGRGPVIRRNWHAEGGGMTKVDDHTIVVDTVIPQYDFTWQSTTGAEAGYGMGMLSKAYYDEVGPERAPFVQAVGTAPWRSESFSGGVWKFDAVEDHWRKTPNFAELDYREIAEESTRLANFQTGNADTVQLDLQSIATLKAAGDPDVKFIQVDTGGSLWLNIYGLQYVDQPWIPAQDCSVAWLSCDGDINSVEWENARKVREAMNIAIDRDLLVETLVGGNGIPSSHYDWLGFGGQLGLLADLNYEFNPARARQLLAEAGFANGFDIPLALTPRPYPAVIEAGEAIAVMWEDIGITTTQTAMPYSAFRSHNFDRDYSGLNTHASGISGDPASRFAGCHWQSCDGFNYGFAHPITDPMIVDIRAAFDETDRYEKLRELSKFMFEQSVTIPIMNVAVVWPLGPQIEPWDFWCCAALIPSRLEYVPHSQ